MSRAPSEAGLPSAAAPVCDGSRRGARVEVAGLGWRPYGRRSPVLSDLSLRLEPGERLLLAGPSGCGKSTLLRALAGLLEVADAGDLTGTVTIDGEPPGARAGAVGMVLQDPGAGVVAGSIDRDVAFGPQNVRMPRAAIARAVTSALARARLQMDLAGPTSALSGGEQQRLALAGALALQPGLLLLDEPTSMLDPDSAAAVHSAVRDIVAGLGLTTVVVEHRLGPWLGFADRLVVLGASGSVVADGPPERVLRERGHELLDQGVWVPGVPAPVPLVLPAGLLRAAAPEGAGRLPSAPVVAADRVTVVREQRALNRPARVTTAVREVSLQAVAGEGVAVVGPSGSGKSTLLRTLAGLVAPTTGSVRYATERPAAGGTPVERAPDPSAWPSSMLARAVGWVPQSASSTLVARTVLGDVLATSRALGVPDGDSRPRALGLLAALGLDALADADPHRLSGGEQRRLAVAAAVLHGPALLLTDEPTVGQDRHTWSAVMGVAEALRRSGAAVVHATHDPDVVALAGRVVRLSSTTPPGHPVAVTRPVADRASLAARCGPLSLLLGAALALPAALSVTSWQVGAVLLAVSVLLSGLALSAPGSHHSVRPPSPDVFRSLGRRLLPGLLAAASVGWSAWLLGGHSTAAAAAAVLRVAVLVYPSAVLLPFVDPDRLAEHVTQRCRLPARPVVAACAALQRAQAVGDLWTELTQAHRVRGLGPTRSPLSRLRAAASVTFAALVDSLAAAGRLAVAMDARGFAAARRRTWLHPAPWRRADSVAVALAAVLPLLGWALSSGWLLPSR